MAGVNKVILIGNLGKDPEVRHLENGTAVANFSLATSESYRDRTSGERKTITEWHNIVLWRGLAEIAEKYLNKGDQVYIEGKLRTRSWEDQNGVTKYTTEVVGDNMTMLGGRPSSQESGPRPEVETQKPVSQPQQQQSPDPLAQQDSDLDDLPF